MQCKADGALGVLKFQHPCEHSSETKPEITGLAIGFATLQANPNAHRNKHMKGGVVEGLWNRRDRE
jgi:hypothetical protein